MAYKMSINRIDNTIKQRIIEHINIPHLPNKWEISTSADNQEYNVIELGGIVVPGAPKLEGVSFSSFCLPTDELLPLDFIGKIKGLMDKKEVFKLIITCPDMAGDDLGDINTLAVVKDFNYYEQGGEVGTIFYTLKITQYRPFGIIKISDELPTVDDEKAMTNEELALEEANAEKIQAEEAESGGEGSSGAEVVDSTGVTWKKLGNFRITFYCDCAICQGQWSGLTALGGKPVVGRTIAVDKSQIPLGSKVKINGHVYVAEDVGGAINRDCIDIFVATHAEANRKGVQYWDVYVEA